MVKAPCVPTAVFCSALFVSFLLLWSGPARAVMDAGTDMDEFFGMSLDELLQTEVTVASSVGMTQRQSPGIVSIVTAEEIRNSGARDLIDVLRLVPGFEFAVDVQGVTSMTMRGNIGYIGRILLMIDGQELNDLAFSCSFLGNHYPVDTIRRIEIIRGAGSAIYGGFAELGVVNIITDNGEETDGLTIGANYGRLADSEGRRNLTVSAGGRRDDLDFVVHSFIGAANRSDRDYTDAVGNTWSMKDRAGMDPAHVNAGLGYGDLHVRLIYDHYELPSRDRFTESTLKAYNLTNTSILGEVRYDWRLTDDLTITPKFNHADINAWQTADEALPGESDAYYRYDRNMRRSTFTLTGAWQIDEGVNLIGGGGYTSDRAIDNLESWTFWNGDYEIDYSNTSAFAQGIIETGPCDLTVGGRIDDHSEYGSAFAPRLGLTKSYGNLHHKLLFNRAFRSPSIEEIDYNSWLDPVAGRPFITPEKTDVIEFETGYSPTPDLFLTFNLFHIKLKDTIVYLVEDNVEGYLNMGQSGSKGLEAEFRVRKERGYLNASYSFYTAADINDVPDYGVAGEDGALLGSAQHKVTVSGSYRLGEGVSVSSSLVCLGKRWAWDWDEEAAAVTLQHTDATVLARVFFNFQDVFAEGVDLGVGVFDLLDQQYDFIQPYDGGHPTLPGPGREFVFKAAFHHHLGD